MLASSAQEGTNSRALTAAAHASFVPIGIVTVLLGPLLPTLSARWSLNYTQAGSLFTAQFLASTVAVSVSGFFVSLRGFRFAIQAGLLAMAAGVALLPWASHELGIAGIACYGIGLGLAVPAANLLVAEVNPSRRSAALNLLNFTWSVGAVACPFLVSAAARTDHVAFFLVAVSILSLLVLIGIAVMPHNIVEPAVASASGHGSGGSVNRRSLFLLASLFFLYVGAENSVGGWTASYAKSLPAIPSSLAVMTPSFFYSALLLGRWIAPFVLRSINDVHLARGGLLLATVGMAGLTLSHAVPGVIISNIVAGLGLAAVYPITISLLSREFGSSATRVGSIMFTVANLGGSTLPWLVGFVSNQFSNLRVGLTIPLIAGIVMFTLYSTNWREAATPSTETA